MCAAPPVATSGSATWKIAAAGSTSLFIATVVRSGTPTYSASGLKLKLMDDKLTFDLGYIRYNYLSAPSSLFYDFSEFGLVAGYDFGVAQVSAAVRYSPNFFANSGNAWYKWASVTVPMPFIHVNDNVAFKAFGTIGNQYVERNINYGIPNDNYWDWQLGLVVSVYGFDLSAVYTGTNLSVQDCLGTQNCASRVILGIGAWWDPLAQKVGIEGGTDGPGAVLALKTFDPERYGSLDHPGDDYSYDLYQQAGAVLRTEARVPFRAVMLYSRAISAQDSGNREEALTLFNQVVRDFPEFKDAETARNRLQGSGGN